MTPAPPDALFEVDAPEPDRPGALAFQAADTAVYDAALAGDSYTWLAAFLPPTTPLPCPRCRRAMRLGFAPLLWACPACDSAPEGENS